MATFGITDPTGYSAILYLDDFINANQAISPASDGIAQSISFYVDQYGANTGNMVFALMEATGTPVATLVAATAEVAITATEGWHTGSFASPPNIYASKSYYICINFDPDAINIWDKQTVGGVVDHAHIYTGSYPATVTAWDDASYTGEMVGYCTYIDLWGTMKPKRYW